MLTKMFDLKAYIKSSEGQARLMDQQPFIAEGQIWQGYNMACFRVEEGQLTDDEINKMEDLDGTVDQVWFRRRQRVESRNYRKSQEYAKRRAELRKARNDIRDSIARDQELGVPQNPSDVAEIQEIDRRMSKLVVLTDRLQIDESVVPEEVKAEAGPPPRVQCADCGENSPEGHKNPEKWLSGHRMGAHKNPRARAS